MALDISAVSTVQFGRLLHCMITISLYGGPSTHQPSSPAGDVISDVQVPGTAACDWLEWL